MFKGTIESSTKQLCKEAQEDWVNAAKKWLEPPIAIEPTAPVSAFAQGSSTKLEEDSGFKSGATHFSRSELY